MFNKCGVDVGVDGDMTNIFRLDQQMMLALLLCDGKQCR